MTQLNKVLAAFFVCSSAVLAGCASGVDQSLASSSTDAPAGLVATDLSDFDQAWLRPGFSVDEFDAVFIEAAQIEFDPDWGRSDQRTGSRLPQNTADYEGTREEMIEVVDQAIREALDKDDRFRIVDQPGPGVLRLRPRIDDLFISAIDPMEMAARTDQYVRSVGYGRPGLQVVDGTTNEVLMQVSDQRETRRYPDLQLANPGLVATDFIEWYRRFSEDALDALP